MKKTGKEIRETEGQFIMSQEVVDWEKVGVEKTISMPDGSKCIFFTEKDKYKALGMMSAKIMSFDKDGKCYINHTLFYNDISETWVCIIYHFD